MSWLIGYWTLLCKSAIMSHFHCPLLPHWFESADIPWHLFCHFCRVSVVTPLSLMTTSLPALRSFSSQKYFWPKNALFFILNRLLSKHSYLRSWYESKTAANFPLLTSLYCMCGLMFSKVIHSNVCWSLYSVNSHCRHAKHLYCLLCLN